ncbi:hypothetical protein FJTKL_06592 [Diaporthe vaccinii]|uniref:Uncharacterized protein n=1 Tax=Diaporthe vaccinii TaxID=105482 RepID=A0ABR4DQF2_9PEZI
MSDKDRESAWSADDHPRYPPLPDWDLWQSAGLPEEEKVGFQELICRQLESSDSTPSGRVKPHEIKDQYATWEDLGTLRTPNVTPHLVTVEQWLV